jgi:hypothetical protein
VNITPSSLPEVVILEPTIFDDPRGQFFETFNAARYADVGIPGPFVQDNVSLSRRGVLRGLRGDEGSRERRAAAKVGTWPTGGEHDRLLVMPRRMRPRSVEQRARFLSGECSRC